MDTAATPAPDRTAVLDVAPVDLAPVLDLTPVDLALAPVRPVRLLLSLLGVIALCGAALGVVITLVYSTVIMPKSEDGRCFILDHTECSSLSSARIEEAGGITLPEGTDIVDSGSTKFLKTGTTFALVRLPEDTAFTAPPGYVTVPLPVHGADESIAEEMRDRGVTEITGAWRGSPGGHNYYSTLVTGRDDDLTVWTYLTVSWNG